MIRRVTAAGMVAIFVLLFVAACGLLEEPEEASGTIEAIPLELESSSGEAAAEEPAGAEPATEDVATEDAAAEQAGDEDAVAEAGSGLVIYTISPEGSEVRFELDEDLRGLRNTVVGTTDQVAGELAVDLNDLTSVQAGVIQVNTRTLVTDNNFRNRAIQNNILETGAYEFITFTPTAVDGLPGSVSEGETVNFTITGDLTIRDVTTEVTFAVEATVDSTTQLSGTASAVVSWSEYGLSIPSVPNVANVEDEVELYIDFVANAG